MFHFWRSSPPLPKSQEIITFKEFKREMLHTERLALGNTQRENIRSLLSLSFSPLFIFPFRGWETSVVHILTWEKRGRMRAHTKEATGMNRISRTRNSFFFFFFFFHPLFWHSSTLSKTLSFSLSWRGPRIINIILLARTVLRNYAVKRGTRYLFYHRTGLKMSFRWQPAAASVLIIPYFKGSSSF